MNAVPEIDGSYNCYLDPVSARQLFADPDFKQLFQGATSANQVFRQGMTNDFLGLRFMPTTEAFVQPHPTLAGLMVRRPIICGQGALVEGDFAGMAAEDVAPREFHRRSGGWSCYGHPGTDRSAATDHRPVLVLDGRVLCSVGHNNEPEHRPYRDERGFQACRDGGAYRLSTGRTQSRCRSELAQSFRPIGSDFAEHRQNICKQPAW